MNGATGLNNIRASAKSWFEKLDALKTLDIKILKGMTHAEFHSRRYGSVRSCAGRIWHGETENMADRRRIII